MSGPENTEITILKYSLIVLDRQLKEPRNIIPVNYLCLTGRKEKAVPLERQPIRRESAGWDGLDRKWSGRVVVAVLDGEMEWGVGCQWLKRKHRGYRYSRYKVHECTGTTYILHVCMYVACTCRIYREMKIDTGTKVQYKINIINI